MLIHTKQAIFSLSNTVCKLRNKSNKHTYNQEAIGSIHKAHQCYCSARSRWNIIYRLSLICNSLHKKGIYRILYLLLLLIIHFFFWHFPSTLLFDRNNLVHRARLQASRSNLRNVSYYYVLYFSPLARPEVFMLEVLMVGPSEINK